MPDPIELPAVDTDPELGDHPETPTNDEILAGREVYETVDDLNDHSNGIDQ